MSEASRQSGRDGAREGMKVWRERGRGRHAGKGMRQGRGRGLEGQGGVHEGVHVLVLSKNVSGKSGRGP